jgi:hypothetical protein
MNSRSKKNADEWDFFINPKTGKIQYNEKCLSCAHDECKQSYKSRIVFCPHYEKKTK